ncbi:hypothetical protein D6833_07340, partial [Candidatus Parcubacteria bacterium]
PYFCTQDGVVFGYRASANLQILLQLLEVAYSDRLPAYSEAAENIRLVSANLANRSAAVSHPHSRASSAGHRRGRERSNVVRPAPSRLGLPNS